MLVLPGGFSYGDTWARASCGPWRCATAWATSCRPSDSGRPVLGICNGFQVLVKAGLLPGLNDEVGTMNDEFRNPELLLTIIHSIFSVIFAKATLTRNDLARFECRWVNLQPQAGSPCVFTQGFDEPIYCPVAHGEGKFVARDEASWPGSSSRGWWRCAMGPRSGGSLHQRAVSNGAGYPWNPNGSQADIAGVCNPREPCSA